MCASKVTLNVTLCIFNSSSFDSLHLQAISKSKRLKELKEFPTDLICSTIPPPLPLPPSQPHLFCDSDEPFIKSEN